MSFAEDKRFVEIRHLDLEYSFHAPVDEYDWEWRAAHLRRQILAGNGLLPMPEKTPLNARIFGCIEHDDYTVEKVYFESFPGFYVTGNLYRPKGKTGPFPAIINPHGHWKCGRLENSADASVPGRCINFAKQGMIAFSYDMVGYCDSKQIVHHWHTVDNDHYHLWGISLAGLQLWNSIRALDFVLSLPEVDSERIGCTGASGGGTQTFLLTAVDDRVKCAAPVNMISSTMQGGCRCENPPLVRLDTDNMEIGALAVPRPLLLVSATGDWTVRTPDVEFPAVGSVYELMGVGDLVSSVQIDCGHNYNKDSREAVYSFFGKCLLGTEGAVKEQPFEVESDEDLMVFAKDPVPSNALDVNGFVKSRISVDKKQMESMRPHNAEELAQFRDTYGPALKSVLAAEVCYNPNEMYSEELGVVDAGMCTIKKLVIGCETIGGPVPALLFTPRGWCDKSPAAVVVHGEGKSALMDDGKPGELVSGLLANGQKVLAIDCFNVGEHVGPPESNDRLTRYAFFTTYNRTDTANRVQDILNALVYLIDKENVSTYDLIGVGDAGLWCLLAGSFGLNIARMVVDAAGFDNANDEKFIEKLNVPCIRRAGDFATAAALFAPGKLVIHNTQGRFKTDWIEDIYNACGCPEALKICLHPNELHAART